MTKEQTLKWAEIQLSQAIAHIEKARKLMEKLREGE